MGRRTARPKPRKRAQRTTLRRKAATHDVVGTTTPSIRIRPKWQRHYRHLVELHSYLSNRRGDLVKDASEEKPVFSLHMADAGTDNYDRDFALSMISSEQNALYEIEQAIERIKDGTYGRCELTGKPIEPERMSAIPWTRFSAEAENQLEREGVVQRTRLGPREEVPKTEATSEEGEES